jgi:hypothetical protein
MKDHNLSFSGALIDVIGRCQGDIETIKKIRTAMKARLDDAAAVHGIDPAAVRRLLTWLQQAEKNEVDCDRNDEIDAAYRVITTGGTPVVPKRMDTELDKVMSLVTNDKPPKIDDIMQTIGCSRGKAHKLRTLAAARLAAKSSSSPKSRERELEQGDVRETQVCEHDPKTGEVSDSSTADDDSVAGNALDDLAFPPHLDRRKLTAAI